MVLKTLIKNISNRNITDIYPDAVIIINALNEIVGWNSKSESVFGYVESEIIGRNIAILLDNSIDKIHLSHYEKTSQILNAKTRKGKDIIVEISCSDLKKDGKTLIALRDITKSQSVIEKLLTEYEKASKIAKSKKGLIALYSTELKNPIHSIISFSEGILDGICGTIDEKQHKYISIINNNANNLLTLTENMIYMSRIETDAVKPEYKVFNADELIESVKNDIAHLFEGKKISFEIDLKDLERKSIYSDETLLRQILLNLLTNAVKFTEAGQIKIRLIHPDPETVKNAGISPPQYFTGKSYVLFSVSDTGMGISKEAGKNLFDENNTSNKIMAKKHGGTGLGLVITKKLIGILGGSIWVVGNSDKGSVFKFIIPAERTIKSVIPQQDQNY